MKTISCLAALFCLLACSTQKQVAQPEIAQLTSDCPKDGVCNVELLDHKSILIKKDDFGRLIYSLEENATKKVVKFTFTKKAKGNIQDGSYSEEVIFEMNSIAENTTLSDASLENTQLLFGRFCYCKGQTGYYKISKGTLTISSESNLKTVALDFKTTEVPQIINHIAFTIK
jgi:hypothetical protein